MSNTYTVTLPNGEKVSRTSVRTYTHAVAYRATDRPPGIINDIRGTTPEELQALAAKYLVPSKDWSMQVLPEKK